MVGPISRVSNMAYGSDGNGIHAKTAATSADHVSHVTSDTSAVDLVQLKHMYSLFDDLASVPSLLPLNVSARGLAREALG